MEMPAGSQHHHSPSPSSSSSSSSSSVLYIAPSRMLSPISGSQPFVATRDVMDRMFSPEWFRLRAISLASSHNGRTGNGPHTAPVATANVSAANPRVDGGPANNIPPPRKKPRQSLATSTSASACTTFCGDPRKSVSQILRLYHALRRNSLLEEEMRGKDEVKPRQDPTVGYITSIVGHNGTRIVKKVGSFPGVDIGDLFYFRMELSCIGMHGPVQSGIEYITPKDSKWSESVAISVISSGGYDTKDDGEVLIYTGQGGKSNTDGKHQSEDQKLERGNLALEGSLKHQVPVRVIRGIKDTSSPLGKVYVYDGLYRVESSWKEKGKSGFEEFKFKLQRLPGQPELGSVIIKLANQLRANPSLRQGVRLKDISGGKESNPVCVVNTVDTECPRDFEYSMEVLYHKGFCQIGTTYGCCCVGPCSPCTACRCLARNGNALAYVGSSGVLVRRKSLVFECGSSCKCSRTCSNRLTQRGPKYIFEVFKTVNKGWGLRSWDTIQAGRFVCEYIGRVSNKLEDMVDNNKRTDYLFNAKNASRNETGWGDTLTILNNSRVNVLAESATPSDLYIDASCMGNLARFINHSCSPNLMVQYVLNNHNDLRAPHVMLFATDNIPPMRELTLDYGYDEATKIGNDLHLGSTDCLCGMPGCRGRLRM